MVACAAMVLRSLWSFAFALVASVASAQTPPPEADDEATREQARGIFAEGVTALEGGDCPTALDRFRRAYEMIHEPSILYNLATAEAECHDEVQAAIHYREFLAGARTGRAARFRADAQRQLRTLERTFGHLDLVVGGLEDGDVILLGERRLDATALTGIEAVAGEHLVTVRRGSVEVASGRVVIAARATARLELTVVYTPPPPPPAEVAREATREDDEPNVLGPAPDRRRRRIVVGSSVAAAAVFSTLVVVYTAR